MANEITIAIEVADSLLADSLMKTARSLPDVRALQWIQGIGEKGPIATETPDIIIVEDEPESGQIFKSLPLLRKGFPKSAIFVISIDRSPEHIVEVMKEGVTEYLVSPVNPQVFENAIEEVRTRLANEGKIAKGSVYSFISSKGGLGTTVIAVNTATAFALQKTSAVAFCDMSFQAGDSTVLLDIVPDNCFVDICNNFHRLDVSLLRGCMTKHPTGLEFLAAPMNPEECEGIRPEHVLKTFDLIKKLFDHIVIDCTSMMVNECTFEAFNASDKVFIVTDLSVPAIRNASRLFKLTKKLGIPSGKVEFVVNRFVKGGSLTIDEIEKTLGKRVFWIYPNDFRDIVSSINKGIPLVKHTSSAPFAKNIFHFIEKLQNPAFDKGYRGIRGTLGRTI